MNLEKPEDYYVSPAGHDKITQTGSLTIDYKFIRDMSGKYEEEAWSIKFGSGDWPITTVVHFPDRDGVKLETSDEPGYREGKNRAFFGLAMMQLIRSGGTYIIEL